MKDGTSQRKIETKVGTLWLMASEKGLCGLYWKKQAADSSQSTDSSKSIESIARFLEMAEHELEEYFAGKRKRFTVPLDVKGGTEFQQRVWQELARIPYGKTISYAELARRVRSPKAVRAVGSANARNPISVFVPCHRVIASSGKLAGYAGGVSVKEKLLALEAGK